jgi:hypothetical protein
MRHLELGVVHRAAHVLLQESEVCLRSQEAVRACLVHGA